MAPSRNSLCACGSGQKFKFCCGASENSSLRPSDAELEILVIKADDEGLRAGEEPRQRAFKNVIRVISYLGIEGVSLVGPHAPAIVNRVHGANNRLFREHDKRAGGVHLGFHMVRDIFCQVHVPIIFGSPEIDVISLVDLSDDQKRLFLRDPSCLEVLVDQVYDLLDFGYGALEFGHTRTANDAARELIHRAHVQLEAAAATATGAYDWRGTLQSALLGTGLALKSALAMHGYDDRRLRSEIGHNLVKAVETLADLEPSFEDELALLSVRNFSSFSGSRYFGAQPSRVELGHILMNAQYIASEVTRQFTDRNIRSNSTNKSRARVYPVIARLQDDRSC